MSRTVTALTTETNRAKLRLKQNKKTNATHVIAKKELNEKNEKHILAKDAENKPIFPSSHKYDKNNMKASERHQSEAKASNANVLDKQIKNDHLPLYTDVSRCVSKATVASNKVNITVANSSSKKWRSDFYSPRDSLSEGSYYSSFSRDTVNKYNSVGANIIQKKVPAAKLFSAMPCKHEEQDFGMLDDLKLRIMPNMPENNNSSNGGSNSQKKPISDNLNRRSNHVGPILFNEVEPRYKHETTRTKLTKQDEILKHEHELYLLQLVQIEELLQRYKDNTKAGYQELLYKIVTKDHNAYHAKKSSIFGAYQLHIPNEGKYSDGMVNTSTHSSKRYSEFYHELPIYTYYSNYQYAFGTKKRTPTNMHKYKEEFLKDTEYINESSRDLPEDDTKLKYFQKSELYRLPDTFNLNKKHNMTKCKTNPHSRLEGVNIFNRIIEIDQVILLEHQEKSISMQVVISSTYLRDSLHHIKFPNYLWPSGHHLLLSKVRRLEEERFRTDTAIHNRFTRRLLTFIDKDNPEHPAWPDNQIVRSGPLAGAGFSYDGHKEEVVCKSCGFKSDVSEWSDDDEDYALSVHMQSKNACDFLNSFGFQPSNKYDNDDLRGVN